MSAAEADEIVGDLLEAGLALAVCRDAVAPGGSAGVDEASAALDRAIRALQLATLPRHDLSWRGRSLRTTDAGCCDEPVQAARRVLSHVARQLEAVARDVTPCDYTLQVLDAARSTSRAVMALDQAR